MTSSGHAYLQREDSMQHAEGEKSTGNQENLRSARHRKTKNLRTASFLVSVKVYHYFITALGLTRRL